jgi:alpha-tubulin suppressor-like RCC1 family protein
LFLIYTL